MKLKSIVFDIDEFENELRLAWVSGYNTPKKLPEDLKHTYVSDRMQQIIKDIGYQEG